MCPKNENTNENLKKDAFNTGDEFPPCFLRLSANYKQKVFNVRLCLSHV